MKSNSRRWWPSVTKRRCDWGLAVRVLGATLSLLTVLATTGCATTHPKLNLGAKPWQHDLMAQTAMQLEAYPIEAGMDDHIYLSKEASSGGRGFAGGGCGCN
ncbi:MAG: DUF4266 domain-containing protein [Gammaproteobacteria bacterium]|nr:DUF4266 domain-containing protein [Gammaproteobacteria bacterium]